MNKLTVSVSPHIRSHVTTHTIMRDVLIALCPALLAGTILFGWRALLVVSVCMVTCVGCEWIFQKAMGKENTASDLSAAVTGMLLGLNLPASIPLWQAMFGCVIAIIVVKQLFGGIGRNFANPAITARIVMVLSFSQAMTTWPEILPWLPGADAVTGATPLAILTNGAEGLLPHYLGMFLGLHGGSLGETCSAAILLGGVYLLARRVISWHTPVAYVGTVFVLTALLGQDPLYHALGGGLMLAAFFMATDYATTPPTKLGKLVFGIGCGLITVLIRVFGSYPEGVSFAILLMNIFTPYISRLTAKRPLGGVRA